MTILDPYFREIREIPHFRPLKKNCAFANVLELLALLNDPASISKCKLVLWDGNDGFYGNMNIYSSTSLFYYKYILGIYNIPY